MPKHIAVNQQQLSFSIIIPTYNQGEYIGRTLDSILEQKYPKTEIIVLDAMSTDKTAKVLSKYGEKIFWLREPDRGQAHAINKGLRMSSGDIVAYLNSDDTYEANTLVLVNNFFMANPNAKFVYGHGPLIDPKDKKIGMYNTRTMTRESLAQSCGISQPTAFWRREITNKVGYFNESYRFTMDYEYWIRVAKKYDLHFVDAPLANTRIHHAAKTSKFRHQLHAEAVRAVREHYGYVHQDWINNYLDTMSIFRLGNSGLSRKFYNLKMKYGSKFLNLRWNKKLSQ